MKLSDEIIKRLCKYLLITMTVGLAAQHIPDTPLKDRETLMIGLIAGITFAIIEMYAPAVAQRIEPNDHVGVKK